MYCPFPYLYSDHHLLLFWWKLTILPVICLRGLRLTDIVEWNHLKMPKDVDWQVQSQNHNIYSILTDHISITIDMFTLYSTPSSRPTGSIELLESSKISDLCFQHTLLHLVFWVLFFYWSLFSNLHSFSCYYISNIDQVL